jgi:DNA invertase Pin-like site-specific DNA recombinase
MTLDERLERDPNYLLIRDRFRADLHEMLSRPAPQPRPRVPDAEAAERICEMRRNGASNDEIAYATGYSHGTVYKTFAAAGLAHIRKRGGAA